VYLPIVYGLRTWDNALAAEFDYVGLVDTSYFSEPIDVKDHAECFFFISTDSAGGGAVELAIQESNALLSGFTDVPGTNVTVPASGLVRRLFHVLTRNPERKRYLRAKATPRTVGSNILGFSLRMSPLNGVLSGQTGMKIVI
jgi:hypothetical protein